MTTLRQVQLSDAAILYSHLSNPCVSRYSRLKPTSVEEMGEMIKYLQNEENELRVIPRVIINEEDIVVGLIILWDYSFFRQEGFLATVIGENHWGRGYNQIAKQLFFDELFALPHLDTIYLLVRKHNERSIAACNKISYIKQMSFAEDTELREFYKGKIEDTHLIFYIKKENYIAKEVSS